MIRHGAVPPGTTSGRRCARSSRWSTRASTRPPTSARWTEMDFTLPPELSALRAEVRRFMDERVLPREAQMLAEDARRCHDTLRALQAEARQAGLFVPHLPQELGGRGLGIMGMCALFREM